MGSWMMGGPMMLVGIGFMAVVLLAVVAGVVWVVRVSGGGDGTRRGGALEELELRYARGDIDHDEFHERRRDLERG